MSPTEAERRPDARGQVFRATVVVFEDDVLRGVEKLDDRIHIRLQAPPAWRACGCLLFFFLWKIYFQSSSRSEEGWRIVDSFRAYSIKPLDTDLYLGFSERLTVEKLCDQLQR